MNQAPISLYFDIEQGESPDLEVIAQASIAWSRLLKEIGSIVDPSVELRVEFLSGTIGSRSINSIVRAVQKVANDNPWTVGPLLTIASVFLLGPVDHLSGHMTDALSELVGHKHTETIDDESIEKIAKRVLELEKNRNAVELRQEVYKHSNKEPKIKGLGTSDQIGQKPLVIIPRSEFQARSGITEEVVESVERKTEWKRDYPVTIVRSYSKAEPRRWRFADGRGEFSATMLDPELLELIRLGHSGIEVGEGVEIRIDLRIKLERVGGVWHEKSLDVMHVTIPGQRSDLLL
jgi:hypothetical protein